MQTVIGIGTSIALLKRSGRGKVRQPIFLTKADGTLFLSASGKPLVRGTRLVTPQES